MLCFALLTYRAVNWEKNSLLELNHTSPEHSAESCRKERERVHGPCCMIMQTCKVYNIMDFFLWVFAILIIILFFFQIFFISPSLFVGVRKTKSHRVLDSMQFTDTPPHAFVIVDQWEMRWVRFVGGSWNWKNPSLNSSCFKQIHTFVNFVRLCIYGLCNLVTDFLFLY